MTHLKPTKTTKRSDDMRSKLERTWADFFDSKGVEWIYEPQAYNLGGGIYYLPDFLLPGSNMFVEVKGEMRDGDLDKMKAFIRPAALDGYFTLIVRDICVRKMEAEFGLLGWPNDPMVPPWLESSGCLDIENFYESKIGTDFWNNSEWGVFDDFLPVLTPDQIWGCGHCGEMFVVSGNGVWTCGGCGVCDGNGHAQWFLDNKLMRD